MSDISGKILGKIMGGKHNSGNMVNKILSKKGKKEKEYEEDED